MSVLLEPPLDGEYHIAFEGYVAKARSVRDVTGKLGEQLEEVEALLRPLDVSRHLHRYAVGKWSVKEVLGHMTDTERIFAYRLLRFARADQTPVPGFDENLYVASADFDKCDWDELLDEFTLVRRASILLLRHLPEAAWLRAGVSNRHALSVRALAFIMIGHVEHHLAIIRERYV
jgi:hypothetical protein